MPHGLRGRKASLRYTQGMPALTSRLLVLLISVLLASCSVVSVDLNPRIRPLEEETVEGEGASKILLTDISGLLSDDATTPGIGLGSPPPRVPLLVRVREELKKAEGDKKVRALILRINSPGGTVTASDIVFREVDAFRRSTKIPVVAVMMDVAASGGYYIALAADTIVAHPTTVTGSIGTIMISLNAEELLRKIGVAGQTIKSGERKDMGSPFRALTPEERAIFQTVIDDLHGQFVAKVVERRRLSPDVAARLADGRIYTAEQALKHGLVDRIGYMSDAIAVARNAAGLSEARVVVYHRPRQYRATYYARSETPPSSLEASLAPLATLVAPGPRFLYLWWP
jgi:protease IV